MDLTEKQEGYCQACIYLDSHYEAYRHAYDAELMNRNSVSHACWELDNNPKITQRISELRNELYLRNKVSIDELVQNLAGMVRFDIGDLYDENNNLLPIKQMPKQARQVIQQLDSDELYDYVDGEKIQIGVTKKVRTLPKLDAIEKLMKHLGGYEKDNFQKKAETNVTVIKWGDKEISI